MVLSVKTRRFTSAEYNQMATAGILHEDDRVELIEGEIVEMAPIGREHASRVTDINHLLVGNLGDVARVNIQNPIHLDDASEPQPDVAVVRPRSDRYRTGLPTPTDVLLLVEVVDSTLRCDRDVKIPLYARTGIPEVWLIDVTGDTFTLFRDPSAHGYKSSSIVSRGESIAPLAFPGREIAVADVLG
jgi:Uma2 family endonuclease